MPTRPLGPPLVSGRGAWASAQWAAVWILGALGLGGCQAVGDAIAFAVLAAALLGGLLIQLTLLVVAVLPLVRKPPEPGEPDLHAPSGPTALGIAALVLSGLVQWVGFVGVMYRPARALLGNLGLAAFFVSAAVHGLTLALVLFSHPRAPEGDDEARRPPRLVGAAVAGVYGMALIAAGLWPWLRPSP